MRLGEDLQHGEKRRRWVQPGRLKLGVVRDGREKCRQQRFAFRSRAFFARTVCHKDVVHPRESLAIIYLEDPAVLRRVVHVEYSEAARSFFSFSLLSPRSEDSALL